MIVQRALEWLIELEDPDMDPFKLQAFARWFLESTAHQDAFIEAMAISAVSRRFDMGHRVDVEQLLSAPDSNVVPFRNELSARRNREGQSSPTALRRKRIPALACASLLILLAMPLVIGLLRTSPDTSFLPKHYAAGIGERLFVPLDDGSSVELNTRSSMEVEVNSQGRHVTLLSGEAVFNVVHDAAHPFRVDSGGIEIQDLGTTFAVRQQGNGTTSVSVLDGRVKISTKDPTHDGKASVLPTIVEAEREAIVLLSTHRTDLKVRPVAAEELTRELSWRDGHLIFTGQTLAEVVATLNRYNRRQIRIPDPAIARQALGGVFTTTDFDGFLAEMNALYALRAVPLPGDSSVLELRQESK